MDPSRSAVRAITLGFLRAASTIPSPKPLRVGNLVFETTEINKGWDGYYKGNPQDPGNYVWIAQGETWQGEFITKQGNAVLIR